MSNRSARRAPLWLLILAMLLSTVSFPVDGFLGLGLGLAGIACGATFLVKHARAMRATR